MSNNSIASLIVRSSRYGKMFLAAAALFLLFAMTCTFHAPPVMAAADAPQSTGRSTGKMDEQRLVGRWLRPDGGYILDLTKVKKDGSLKAAYSNPRPINVAKAMFSRKDGRLTVFVELRDVNYPGSQYNLQYDPKTDRLMGTYFQAALRETFDVVFVRVK